MQIICLLAYSVGYELYVMDPQKPLNMLLETRTEASMNLCLFPESKVLYAVNVDLK